MSGLGNKAHTPREEVWHLVRDLHNMGQDYEDESMSALIRRLAMALSDFELSVGFPDAYVDRFIPRGRT